MVIFYHIGWLGNKFPALSCFFTNPLFWYLFVSHIHFYNIRFCWKLNELLLLAVTNYQQIFKPPPHSSHVNKEEHVSRMNDKNNTQPKLIFGMQPFFFTQLEEIWMEEKWGYPNDSPHPMTFHKFVIKHP